MFDILIRDTLSKNWPNLIVAQHKLILLSFFIMMSGCADVSLVQKEVKATLPSVQSKDSFCVVDPIEEAGMITKIIFIVDVSGSNGNTDPSNQRFNHIKQFIADLSKQDASYQYATLGFRHGSDGIVLGQFTNDVNEVYGSLDRLSTRKAGSFIESGVSLPLAEKIIQDDLSQFDQVSQYFVFFISDGRVSDNLISVASDLVSRVDNVYVSTAYYGPTRVDAMQRLEKMSEAGKGSFANFEIGESWDLSQLLSGEPDVVPWSLKEFLVYNLNAGFCLDGEVGVDSDVDGMCDRDEIAMNNIYAEKLETEGKLFDPANRFSFGDGYGDFFHWLRFRYPGKTLPLCEDRSDEDFDLLTVCEENELELRFDGGVIKGDPQTFDTDKDGILDGIETFVYFTSQSKGGATRYTAALDPTNLNDNLDGEESIVVQIRQHRNPWLLDSDIEAYDTHLTPLISSEGDCYTFEQTVLPLYETLEVKEGNTLPGLERGAGENSIMVYYIQVLQPAPNSVGVLKHSVQKVKWDPLSSHHGLKVNEEQFKEYIPPKASSKR